MRFVKGHGAGNDFVLLPDWDDRLRLSPAVVRALCDRRHGVGGDGVLRVVGGDGDTDVVMDYRNRDGSAAEMCGNGVRVVVKYAVEAGLVRPGDGHLRVGTRAGTRDVRVHLDGGEVTEITVDMGPPRLDPATVPFDAPGPEAVDVPVDVDGETVRLTAVSMGNPHAVVVVEDVGEAPVATLGPRLERHPRFPQGVNVEFVTVAGPGDARVRVWERGAGETPACGSGACAVLVALQRLARGGQEATLRFPGGDLRVFYAPGDHPSVFLTGAAAIVAEGEVDPRWLEKVVY